jgi:hypothetical protein
MFLTKLTFIGDSQRPNDWILLVGNQFAKCTIAQLSIGDGGWGAYCHLIDFKLDARFDSTERNQMMAKAA